MAEVLRREIKSCAMRLMVHDDHRRMDQPADFGLRRFVGAVNGVARIGATRCWRVSLAESGQS